MSAASAATAATTAAATATATTATTTTTGAGKHRVVDYEPNLSAEVLHKIYGSFLKKWNAVSVHQQVDSVQSQDRIVGLGLLFHGQHVLDTTGFCRHCDNSQGAIGFPLFFHDFLEFFYG